MFQGYSVYAEVII